MIIKIGKFDFSEVWDGVYYKSLPDYPEIQDYQLKDIIDFAAYEEANGRKTQIECDSETLTRFILREMEHPEKYRRVPRPSLITECTACPGFHGCKTDFLCHTAQWTDAVSIFRCGSLLSAVRAREKDAVSLAKESRNAAKDPPDFFHYVMFTWGNCQAGDRLVNERKLGRSPTPEELGAGFTPGVRFFFRYEDLEKHPDAVHDGFLPIKVRNGVILRDYLCAAVIPSVYREALLPYIPDDLAGRVFYLGTDGLDIWQWSAKVYRFVASRFRN